MSFTSPRTWVYGETVTEAQLNEQIRDNQNAMWVGTTAGDMDFYTSNSGKSRIGIGNVGDVLTVNSSTVPAWAAGGMSLISGTTFAGTVAGGGTTTFSDIDQTYSHLKVICSLDCGGTNGQLHIIANNDLTKTNYETNLVHFYNDTTTLQSNGNSSYAGLFLGAVFGFPSYYPASIEFTIMNYSNNSMYKFCTQNPTGYYTSSRHLLISSCLYKDNSPITSLSFSFIANNITTILPGSKISIYGIR